MLFPLLILNHVQKRHPCHLRLLHEVGFRIPSRGLLPRRILVVMVNYAAFPGVS